MKAADVRTRASAMPLTNPSYPPGPYRFVGREHLIVTYATDPAAVARIVPQPLEPLGDLVRMDFVSMPDSTGFGIYHGAAQTIPVRLGAVEGAYTRLMFLDVHAPIAGGRELWGFPQKLAAPRLGVDRDTLLGGLDFGPVPVASATMGYKHQVADAGAARAALLAPTYLLKIMPHVDGTPRICELVQVTKSDLVLHGAWTGPAALALRPHALAPLTDLPVRAVTGALHVIADYTLDLGTVVHDYLA